MELLGRETELASVDRAVQDARNGGACALGLFGEAGIGKSALLGALRDRASAPGMLVLDGRAAEHERSVPVALLLDDPHWADDASVELVLHCCAARRARRTCSRLRCDPRSRRRACSTPPARRPPGSTSSPDR